MINKFYVFHKSPYYIYHKFYKTKFEFLLEARSRNLNFQHLLLNFSSSWKIYFVIVCGPQYHYMDLDHQELSYITQYDMLLRNFVMEAFFPVESELHYFLCFEKWLNEVHIFKNRWGIKKYIIFFLKNIHSILVFANRNKIKNNYRHFENCTVVNSFTKEFYCFSYVTFKNFNIDKRVYKGIQWCFF